MPATITDVARTAGVGRGTVSRVLNNRPYVDPATRARVLDAIAALDFVPSSAARRLSLRKTQSIAVVTLHLTRPSVVERLRGIESALVDAALDMIVINVETIDRRDAILRDVPRPERIDGMILISLAPHDAELAQIRRSGLPVVLIDAHHRALPRVVCDDVGGGMLAATHLLERGHRRFGFIGDEPRPILGVPSSRMRLRGAALALRAHGLAMRPEHVAEGEHTRQFARELTETMLRSKDRPTAIIAASDTKAIGVLEAARALGIDVPGELSVIGYDDVEAADFVGLTTIHQPLAETGARAVRRMIGLIAGAARVPLREVLQVTLVERRTTGPAPA
jgi:LacI family transcriptional regulator